MIKKFAWIVALSTLGAGVCHADDIYKNGFETGTGDWNFSQVNSGYGTSNGAITQTASGQGPLGVQAFQGNYYATITGALGQYAIDPNSTAPSPYANGGFSRFEGAVAPSGTSFTQQVSVYIDPSAARPGTFNSSVAAFEIDTAPNSSAADPSNRYGGEHNFQLYYNGTNVTVGLDGSTPAATITKAGWYTFQDLYSQGLTSSGASMDTMTVFDANGNVVGTPQTLLNNSDNTFLDSADLAGPGYEWITAWQNNFSNNYLAIDNLESDTPGIPAATPEPSSLALLGTGLAAVAGAFRRRIRA